MEWTIKKALEGVPNPYGDEAFGVLQRRTENGAKLRFGNVDETTKNRLYYELDALRENDAAKLFLYYADIVDAVKSKTYPYVCSVQNVSLVSYCLGVTKVNPLKTGSYFERLLNKKKRKIPVLHIEVPNGKSESVRQILREEPKGFWDVEENADLPDLPPHEVDAFFDGQKYDDKEIFKKLSVSHNLAEKMIFSTTIDEFSDLLVRRRNASFQEENALWLYQEDIARIFQKAGLSVEDADYAIYVFALKRQEESEYYKKILLKKAMASGLSYVEADKRIFRVVHESVISVCRASFTALAQYMYMCEYFKNKNI